MSDPFFIIRLKSDLSLDDCIEFINALSENGIRQFERLMIALPYTRLCEMINEFPKSGIEFGVDVLNSAEPDDFTGPISAKLIHDIHGVFALIGTKDEREFIHSPNQFKYKIDQCFSSKITPIFCIPDVSEEKIEEELELLKQTALIEKNLDPLLIYDVNFSNFRTYFPTPEEIRNYYDKIVAVIEKVFGKKDLFKILISLPSDVVGFSEVLENNPFAGAFFTKSGTYPHSVHSETHQLFQVKCSQMKV